MKPTLLVLAAGLGSRYGGLKQLAGFGPNGETILEYSVFDAGRAGFGRVLFVIRRDFAVDFESRILSRFAGRMAADWVAQEQSDVPPGAPTPAGRIKPWGTGHAVLAARHALQGPFAVVNADDFYGFAALQTASGFLREYGDREPGGGLFNLAAVAYPLERTLSAHGTVSRGICVADASGWLQSVTEHTKLRRQPDGLVVSEEAGGITIDDRTPVSMNLWALRSGIFPAMWDAFAGFLASQGQDPRCEFYLPQAIDGLVQDGLARVRLEITASDWLGVTYPEDRDGVRQRLAACHQRGEYPARLWE